MDHTLYSAGSSNANYVQRMARDSSLAGRGNDEAMATGGETVQLPKINPRRVDSKELLENHISDSTVDQPKRKRTGKEVPVSDSSENTKLKKVKDELRQAKLFKDIELLEAKIKAARQLIQGGQANTGTEDKESSEVKESHSANSKSSENLCSGCTGCLYSDSCNRKSLDSDSDDSSFDDSSLVDVDGDSDDGSTHDSLYVFTGHDSCEEL